MEPSNRRLKLNITHLQSIPHLLCNVCKYKVYNYRDCQTWMYCCYDCWSVLMLNYMINNNEYKSFNEYFKKMNRT